MQCLVRNSLRLQCQCIACSHNYQCHHATGKHPAALTSAQFMALKQKVQAKKDEKHSRGSKGSKKNSKKATGKTGGTKATGKTGGKKMVF